MEINKQNTIIFFLLLFTGSLIVRIPSLQESLWFDEAYRTFLMLNSDNISKVLFHDVHNFLYNGLMYLWINIFGDSELSIRIPSLLLGYAATFIFCSWTHRKFGPSMALGVLIWVLFSPFHIWYSTEAKNNALVMFFAVSVFVSYANLLENGGWKWVLIATVAGTLGIFSDFLLMLPLISILVMAVVDLIRNFSKDTLKKILIAFISTIFLVSPLIMFKLSLTNEMFRSYMKALTLEELYLFLFNFLSNGNNILRIHFSSGLSSLHGLGHWMFLILSSLLLIIVFIKGMYSFFKTRAGSFVNISFVVPIIIILCMTWYVTAQYGKGHFVYLERSLGSILFYLYAIILLYGANKISVRKVRYVVLASIFTLNIIGTGLMLTVNKDKWNIWLPNPDWRAYANDIREDLNGAMIFTNCPSLAMKYYLKDLKGLVTPLKIDPKDSLKEIRAHILSEFQKRQVRNPRFFYIAINRYWDPFRVRLINDKIIRWTYPKIEERHYLALDVYKYSLDP